MKKSEKYLPKIISSEKARDWNIPGRKIAALSIPTHRRNADILIKATTDVPPRLLKPRLLSVTPPVYWVSAHSPPRDWPASTWRARPPRQRQKTRSEGKPLGKKDAAGRESKNTFQCLLYRLATPGQKPFGGESQKIVWCCIKGVNASWRVVEGSHHGAGPWAARRQPILVARRPFFVAHGAAGDGPPGPVSPPQVLHREDPQPGLWQAGECREGTAFEHFLERTAAQRTAALRQIVECLERECGARGVQRAGQRRHMAAGDHPRLAVLHEVQRSTEFG